VRTRSARIACEQLREFFAQPVAHYDSQHGGVPEIRGKRVCRHLPAAQAQPVI
jgi:hypothetical protein